MNQKSLTDGACRHLAKEVMEWLERHPRFFFTESKKITSPIVKSFKTLMEIEIKSSVTEIVKKLAEEQIADLYKRYAQLEERIKILEK